MDQPPYTSGNFHEDVQRQLISTAAAKLAESKVSWPQIAPFLDAGRAVCRDDLRLGGRVAIHGLEHAGDELVPADEAYLSLSASDRDSGVEWLSETYWLSDLALADEDPERVRAAIAGLERSVARLKDWLAERESDGTEQEPTSPQGGEDTKP